MASWFFVSICERSASSYVDSSLALMRRRKAHIVPQSLLYLTYHVALSCEVAWLASERPLMW